MVGVGGRSVTADSLSFGENVASLGEGGKVDGDVVGGSEGGDTYEA